MKKRIKKIRRNKPFPTVEKKYKYSQLKKMLREKQKRFCAEYVKNGWNGTQAYMKIYKVGEFSAAALASAALRRDAVRQYIEYLKTDFEKLCGVSKASQIAEYRKIAYSTIAHLHDKWYELKDYEKLIKENPDAVAAIESTEYKTMKKVIDHELYEIEFVKVKLHSKLAALQRIDKLMDYEVAEKIKLDSDSTVNLGTGSVEAIRRAFQLDKLKNPNDQ